MRRSWRGHGPPASSSRSSRARPVMERCRRWSPGPWLGDPRRWSGAGGGCGRRWGPTGWKTAWRHSGTPASAAATIERTVLRASSSGSAQARISVREVAGREDESSSVPLAPRRSRMSRSTGEAGPSRQVTRGPSPGAAPDRSRAATWASVARSELSAKPPLVEVPAHLRQQADQVPSPTRVAGRWTPGPPAGIGGAGPEPAEARPGRPDGPTNCPSQPPLAPARLRMTSRSTADGARRRPRAARAGSPSARRRPATVVHLTLVQPRPPAAPQRAPRARRTKTAA